VALIKSTTHTKRNLDKETGQTEPGLVALYNIGRGNGAGLLLQARNLHGSKYLVS